MRKYTTQTERQCYELGMQAGRKEMVEALRAVQRYFDTMVDAKLIENPSKLRMQIQDALAEGTVKA